MTEIVDPVILAQPTRRPATSSLQNKKSAKPPRSNPLEEDSEDEAPPLEDKDPFYDEDLDEEDQQWLDAQRPQGTSSDAVLNCPACFAPLTQDCQRSTVFSNQYRAIFVSNVVVCKEEETRPVQGDDDPDAKYWNVRCELCGCHVAVMDSEEVYHFFHVLADPGHSAVSAERSGKARGKRAAGHTQRQLQRKTREAGTVPVRRKPLPPLKHR